jgi:hypothetical protein
VLGTYRFGALSGATISTSLGGSSINPCSSLIRWISPLLGLIDFNFPLLILDTASLVNRHFSSGSDVLKIKWAKPSSELGSSSGSEAAVPAGRDRRDGPASGAWSMVRVASDGIGGSANSDHWLCSDG